MNIIIAVLVFSSILLVHEAGHYIAARCTRVIVTDFSIGMGPRIACHTDIDTGEQFSLRLFPIGGYVSFLSRCDIVGRHASYATAYENQKLWKRLIITLSGSMANILFAATLSIFLAIYPTVLQSLTAYAEAPSQELVQCSSTGHIFGEAFQEVTGSLSDIFMHPDRITDNVSGPFSMICILSEVVSLGADALSNAIIYLSISIGLLNLLPLPGLDGGEMIMLLLEKCLGHSISAVWQNRINRIGQIGFACLALIALVGDFSYLLSLFCAAA